MRFFRGIFGVHFCPIFACEGSGCRKRSAAKGVRSLFFVFGTLSVTFRSLFLTLLSLFSSPFARLLLPDSFCGRVKGVFLFSRGPGFLAFLPEKSDVCIAQGRAILVERQNGWHLGDFTPRPEVACMPCVRPLTFSSGVVRAWDGSSADPKHGHSKRGRTQKHANEQKSAANASPQKSEKDRSSTAKLRIWTLRIWGFRGPGFRSARQVVCGVASHLFLDHFLSI